MVYIARAAQRKVMSVALMPGSRLPAYCTSMGRVLFASLSVDEARRHLSAKPLQARTSHTLTNLEAILTEVAKVKEQGFAIIDQEVELGLRSIAVPLFNVRNRVVAAVNVGLAATQAHLSELETTYLPHLLKFQTNLKSILA